MQIGPYQLTRSLGKGGMGEVWLGTRTAMGSAARLVAVKLLHSSDPAARDNFIKEATLAMMLRHSTIVQVIDVGEADGTCFMEMEWVDGLDLARLAEQLRQTGTKIDIGVAAYIIGELLKALAFAHGFEINGRQETIVHRDISPQNVLVSRAGEVKLTDFGIAFMTSDKTSSEFIKGKSRYMSPEHVRQAREPCIDIFGVGAIFHELVDGRKFRYTAESNVDLWAMAFAGNIPPLSVELPSELERLHRGLLACELSKRFTGAREALSVLRGWSGYRDESEALEQLVRELTAEDALVAATEQLPVASLADTESTEVEQAEAVPDADGVENSSSRTADAVRVAPTPPAHRGVGALAVALALVGLAFGGVAVGALIQRGGELSETPVAESAIEDEGLMTGADGAGTTKPASQVASGAPPSVEPQPESPPTPTEPEPEADVATPPVERPDPPDAAEEAPKPADTTSKPKRKPKSAAKPNTEVTLTASGFPWVQIRIGSDIYVLDRRSSPSRKISFKPGSYAFAFRIDEEESWTKVGSVRIPEQPSARLELRKPGTFVIE